MQLIEFILGAIFVWLFSTVACLTPAQQQEVVNAHNNERSTIGLVSFTYDASLEYIPQVSIPH
jgi:energy-converting hydrogenase Eha subunit E